VNLLFDQNQDDWHSGIALLEKKEAQYFDGLPDLLSLGRST
jgi:hypothetical protein